MSYFKHLVVASILSASLLNLSCKKDPVSNIIVVPPPPPVDPTPPFNPYIQINATDWSKIADSTYLCSFPDIFIPKYMAGKTTTVFLVVNSSVRLKVSDSGLNFFGGHLTAVPGPSDLEIFIHSDDGTLKLPPQGLMFVVSIQ